MKKISAQDEATLLRLASSLPVGDETRRAILSGISQIREAAGCYERNPPFPKPGTGSGKPGKRNCYDLHNEYDSTGYKTKPKGGYTKADAAKYNREYYRKWRHEGHKDRTKSSPDGYGGSFNPSKAKKNKKKDKKKE